MTCCKLAKDKNKDDIDPSEIKDSDLKGYKECKLYAEDYFYASVS